MVPPLSRAHLRTVAAPLGGDNVLVDGIQRAQEHVDEERPVLRDAGGGAVRREACASVAALLRAQASPHERQISRSHRTYHRQHREQLREDLRPLLRIVARDHGHDQLGELVLDERRLVRLAGAILALQPRQKHPAQGLLLLLADRLVALRRCDHVHHGLQTPEPRLVVVAPAEGLRAEAPSIAGLLELLERGHRRRAGRAGLRIERELHGTLELCELVARRLGHGLAEAASYTRPGRKARAVRYVALPTKPLRGVNGAQLACAPPVALSRDQ
eukprot:6401472-Prymnesium_polylepis.3